MTVNKADDQFGVAQSQTSQHSTSTASKQPVLPFVAPQFAYATGDLQDGNLATPINGSEFSRWFIQQLPAYRPGVSAFQRGLQVGLAHGFWLLGPFVVLGPLRNTGLSLFAGLLATIGVVAIATLALLAYAASVPPPPIATLTTPNPPAILNVPQGWQEFARGFLFGGMSGAVFAAVLLLIFGNVPGVPHL